MVEVKCIKDGTLFLAERKNARYCPKCKDEARTEYFRKITDKRSAERAEKRTQLKCKECGDPIINATRIDTERCLKCADKRQAQFSRGWEESHKEYRAMKARERRHSEKIGAVGVEYIHNCKDCGEEFLAFRSDALFCDKCIVVQRDIRQKLNSDHRRVMAKNRHLKIKYDLTIDEFNAMVERQDNKCALCKEVFSRTPHVEHDHSTGNIRGLVCQNCNIGLRYLDDEEWLFKARQYLHKDRLPWID